jgi:uncharacterized protein YhbP (UPF0306 family)
LRQDALRARVLEYLRAHHVVTLATHGHQGPWAAAVFYVNDGFTLYFLSAPKSRHGSNVVAHPRIAATIQDDYADWPDIKGVQLEGVASEISGDEQKRARALYGEKFPVVGKLSKAPAAIVAALAKVRWYKIVPVRLYFVDNSVAFGHRDEIELATNLPHEAR